MKVYKVVLSLRNNHKVSLFGGVVLKTTYRNTALHKQWRKYLIKYRIGRPAVAVYNTDIFAFESIEHAQALYKEYSKTFSGNLQIWEGTTPEAKRCFLAANPNRVLFDSFWAADDRLNFSDVVSCPSGTVVCKQLTLIRRIGDNEYEKGN